MSAENSTSELQALKRMMGRIKLLLDGNPNTVVLLVEGKTDEKLFERVFECKNCIIKCMSVNGKENLYALLAVPVLQQARYVRRVIAVRDRDYTDPAQYPEKMFAYDCCAMELMLLRHPKMQDMLRNFYPLRERFPLEMLKRIALFSLLRQENDESKKSEKPWGLNFEKPGVLAGSENNMPNMEKLFSIYEKNCSALQGKYEEYRDKADRLPEEILWDITNGHDICALLGKHYKLADKFYPLSDLAYCDLMIGIYKPEYFQDTRLYQDNLSTYELSDTYPFRFESANA